MSTFKGLALLSERGSDYLLIALISMMLLSVSLQVLFRYVVQSPLEWSEEVARFSLVWATFIGASGAVLKEEHYSIDLLTQRLPKRIEICCRMLVHFTIIVFGVVMAWGGVTMVSTLYSAKSAALRIPLGLVYAVMPLSGALIVLNSDLRIWYRPSATGGR